MVKIRYQGKVNEETKNVTCVVVLRKVLELVRELCSSDRVEISHSNDL